MLDIPDHPWAVLGLDGIFGIVGAVQLDGVVPEAGRRLFGWSGLVYATKGILNAGSLRPAISLVNSKAS